MPADRTPSRPKRRGKPAKPAPSRSVGAALRDLGLVLHIPGVMAAVSLPVAVGFAESVAIWPFLWTALASIVAGQALYHGFRRAEESRLRNAMVTTVIAWIAIPLFGMLPFLLIADSLAADPATPDSILVFRHSWNALFEAVSGITGTGLTMVPNPAELPRSLQWWRSLMQWVGGVGVIALMLTVFHPSERADRLYYAEARERQIRPDVVATLRMIWWIYLAYTAFGVALLWLAGMPWWEALNHAMAGIATGGFTVTEHSLADYGAGAQLAMIVLMILGATSFVTHSRMLTRLSPGVMWADRESRLLLILLAGGTVVLLAEIRWSAGAANGIDALFQWTSALCTAGFSTANLAGWSPTAQLLLVAAMVVGGAAGATTGGLKLKRVLWLLEAFAYRIRRVAVHPWLLMEHKPIAQGSAGPVTGPHVEAAVVIAVLWVIAIFAGTTALLHLAGENVPLNAVIFEATSALGNVGLSAGVTGPDLHWGGKLSLIVLMWMGRLEIVPVLVLVSALFGFLRRLERGDVA